VEQSSTNPDIEKAYGIRKLRDTLGIAIQEMIFVGDALFSRERLSGQRSRRRVDPGQRSQ